MTYIPTPITKDDSASLTTLLMQNYSDIAATLQAGGGGSAATLTAKGFKGIIVDGDPVEHNPQLPPSPSLAIVLVEGTQLLISGAVQLPLEEDTLLIEVPASRPGGVYGFISLDENGEPEILPEHWYDTYPTGDDFAEVTGLPCVGLVITNATEVLSIDYTRTNKVYTEQALNAKLLDLESRLGVLEGGGSGDSGVSPYTSLQQWKPSDPALTGIVIQSLLDALEASLRAEILSGGRRPMSTYLDQLMHELAIARQTGIILSPENGERSQSANVLATVDGIYGNGVSGHPNHIVTNLTLNDDGTLEP